jgi:SNF2 family DNA or RNA helicase
MNTIVPQLPEAVETNHGFEDPFLYDTDKLLAIASEAVIQRGLSYFKEDRVTDLHWEDSSLCATVEGSQPDEPYRVELSHDDHQHLQGQCDCAFDREPLCKHAVAVLFSYADQLSYKEEIGSAKDLAIEERTKRGRSEVRVSQLSGEPWFGTWRAASIASATHRKQTYTVHIRSLHARINYCTCPDLATNQLGTCKHIEAVLHQIRKRRDYKKIRNLSPTVPFVYLAWDVDDAPKIKVQRVPGTGAQISELIAQYFDSAGFFKGQLPDDFFRFSDDSFASEDIQIGEDAHFHVRRLAAEATHKAKAQQIHTEISRFGGHLPGIRTRLYPYQLEGVAFLAATGRALLADDMGLGKTLQAICAASWLGRNADVNSTLVVCPASLKHQWAREIERFTAQQAEIVQGGPDLRQAQYRKSKPFVVVNYELVLRDLSVINEILRPDLLILDEAQRIKNWRTKIASTIKLIPTRYAFVLTGTPLENRLEDLYSLLQVVDPYVLGPLWRCMLDFHITDERGKVIGYRNLSELRRRIAPVMLRRDRGLVRDQLPDRIEQRLDVPLTSQQKELHDSALSAAARLAQIATRRPLTPSEQHRLMASLQQARMACNAAALVDPELPAGSPKLDELENLLEELCVQSGLKAVIFSQWERMTAMVEDIVHRLKIGCVRLHGGVPTHKRGELLDRFREHDATQVFISTDAGGTGLNLQSASVLINLDMPWNPAVLEQRIARVHRLGQQNTVQIILLVAADSYEERVMQLVQNKRELFDNVVTAEATEDVVGVSKKTLDDLIDNLLETETKAEVEPSAQVLLEQPTVEEHAAASDIKDTGVKTLKDDEEGRAIRHCIERIQSNFGPRIERILGSRGGLLVVMDRVDDESEQIAQELSRTVPVALIDPITFTGLQRLGTSSLLGQTETYFKAGQDAAQQTISPLKRLAREKLEAAEVLVEQKHPTGAIELLASAMLSAAAAKAGRSRAPSEDEASVWIYSEAAPKGYITTEQASALTRAVALSKAQEVPDSLIYTVLEDARMLVSGLESPL